MTPAEQRVLDAARAYRNAPTTVQQDITSLRLLLAADRLPRTLPPPVVTANPAEVVQGEVRSFGGDPYAVDEIAPAVGPHSVRVTWSNGQFSLLRIYSVTCDPLVSRPGVDL